MPHNARTVIVGLVALCTFLVVAPAQAQQCRGLASLNGVPLQIGADVAFAGDTQRNLAGSFVGGRDSFFGGLGAQYSTLTSTNLGASSIVGGAGGELPSKGPAHLCALTQIAYTSGPTLGVMSAHAIDVFAGAQLGIVIAETPTLAVIPTLGAGVQLARETFEIASTRSTTSAQEFGVARFGVGLVVHQQFAVTPMFVVPFAGGPNQTSFSVAMTYNFSMR